MDKLIETSKHHIILTKGVENNLTESFDKISEIDKDFKKIWDHDRNSKKFFMHVNATNELSEKDTKELAEIIKKLHARVREEKHQKREARKKAKLKAPKTKTNLSLTPEQKIDQSKE